MGLSIKSPTSKQILIAVAIAFFMLLTRGSHMLTSVSLPDASIVLFLLGGLFLKRAGWFATFFVLATVIDFGTAAFDPAQGFCLTDGYWGLIPAYGAMWLAGMWLGKQKDAFSIVPYTVVAMLSSFVAFVISTQTYYLFSGRFPAEGIIEAMKHGWVYLPVWMSSTVVYFALIWLSVTLLRRVRLTQISKV